jgi:hypothetical protein
MGCLPYLHLYAGVAPAGAGMMGKNGKEVENSMNLFSRSPSNAGIASTQSDVLICTTYTYMLVSHPRAQG